MLTKPQLWSRLSRYHFENLAPPHLWDTIASRFGGENPFTLAFADKLARKLGWNREFALKAILEYKKFVYLGVVGDFSVTPSKIIDQVWHEHLLFTEGYRIFCEDVIQYKFNHNPELVPMESETEKFESQYIKTLQLYQKEFDAIPPRDIWAAPKFISRKVMEQEGTYSTYAAQNIAWMALFPLMHNTGTEEQNDTSGTSHDNHHQSSDNTDNSGGDFGGSDSGSSCSSCSGGCGGS